MATSAKHSVRKSRTLGTLKPTGGDKRLLPSVKGPCSTQGLKSYQVSPHSCYTSAELRKMAQVLKRVRVSGANEYNPKSIKPWASKNRGKGGLVDTLQGPLGEDQRSWPDKFDGYYESHMKNADIKPRPVTKEELERKQKPISRACRRGTWLDTGDILVALDRLIPTAILMGVAKRGDKRWSNASEIEADIKRKVRERQKEGVKRPSQFYYWVLNPGNHWTVLVLDDRGEKRTLVYLDSLAGKPPKLALRIASVLGLKLRTSTTKFQRNASDCGMWAIFFVYSLFKRTSLKKLESSGVTDRDMQQLRKDLYAQT
jgi:hypothetical protein